MPVLRIGTLFPLPQKLVADFVARCEQVVVLEEPDFAIEIQIRDKRNVLGRMDGTVPSAGELTPEIVYALLADLLAQADVATLAAGSNGDLQDFLNELALPIRKPRMCPGCPHRSSFFAIKRTFPHAILPSDIGCYSLGINQRAVDTMIDMGASITIASGMYRAYQLDGKSKPIVATIGDSTFIHSGVPGLSNAVHTGARFILIVMDNGTTAMTGLQPTAQSEELAFGETDKQLSIERLVLACGVDFVREVDPYDFETFQSTLKDADSHTKAESGGVAVIIAKRACILYDRSTILANPIRVEVTEACDGCNYCMVAFECPALVLSPDSKRVDIDRRICIDCGECIEGCYKGFIVPQAEVNLVDLATT